jgi:cytochrome b561
MEGQVPTTKEGLRDDSYDKVSIAFHWITVILILAMFVLVLVPGIVKGSVTLHKSIGISLIVIIVARLIWRLFAGHKPVGTSSQPPIMQLAATAGHWALYALVLVTAALGWLYADIKGLETRVFGLELPPLVGYDRVLAFKVYAWKQIAAYSLLALIFVHAAAAIVYHHLIKRDFVLRSMVPHSFRPKMPEHLTQ